MRDFPKQPGASKAHWSAGKNYPRNAVSIPKIWVNYRGEVPPPGYSLASMPNFRT